MQDHECNISTLKQTTIPPITRTNLEEILELLLNSHDIHILARILSTFGIYLLSSETHHDRIIKCDPLYDKITLVLNSGLQAKTTVALNLICALLYLNDGEEMRKKSLHVYAQYMIRISGCLTAMTNLFINFMLHQDTLKALCRSISEACRDSTSNQTYCSHLVPLCIRRCHGGSSDMFIVLQSLLSNNNRNVKLFYESNGMTIFTRESLQHQVCLQLLNTIVENMTSESRDILLKSSHIFEHLRYLLHRYGASNLIGQWASIILFSHRKVLRRNDRVNNICISRIKEKESNCYSRNNSKKGLNETNELFRNILNEVIRQQNADYKHYKNTKQIINKTNKNNNNTNFVGDRDINTLHTIDVEKKKLKENVEYKVNNNILSEPIHPTADNDLSFSFLLQAHPAQSNMKDHKFQTFEYDTNSTTSNNYNNNSTVFPSYNQTDTKITQKLGNVSIPKLSQEEDKDITFSFAPPFVSTPKSSRRAIRPVTMSQSSRWTFLRPEVTNRKCARKYNIISKKIKKSISENKKIQDKTIGAKFFDIVNGSCTTLVKSFTSFKNIFRSKEPSTYKNVSINTSYTDQVKLTSFSNSFTTYMRNRDAVVSRFNKGKHEILMKHRSNIEDDDLCSCNTCDNTIALKQKFTNDATLQKTIKRLKLGINLYGCDFKKISRTMWPNEHYMTPSVLYNLYRKLIIK